MVVCTRGEKIFRELVRANPHPLDMLRLFLATLLKHSPRPQSFKWGKWRDSWKSLERRRHHCPIFLYPITILSTERCHRKRMLTYIHQLLLVSFFWKKVTDLHHLVVVCFRFWKVCWLLTTPSRCLFLILKSMLTFTQALSVFDFEKYEKCTTQ